MPVTHHVRGTYITKQDSFQLRNLYQVAQHQEKSQQSYIISADINDIPSGLGCMLYILLPAWKYALKTRRTLIIDWRGNPYTRTQAEKNLFSALFATPTYDEIGVQCIADDSVNDLKLPQPILGPSHELQQESGVIHKLPRGGTHPQIFYKIMAHGMDVPFPTLLPPLSSAFALMEYNQGQNEAKLFGFEESRKFYQSLRPLPKWFAKIESFYQTYMKERNVIGVHIRHGNGEGNYREHFKNREIVDFKSLILHLEDKIKRYAQHRFGNHYSVFLCTDSDDVVTALKPLFPSFITRRIWRPAPGTGIDFDHAYKLEDGGIEAAGDALIDMQLLAKCDAVMMVRKTCFASHVPYILEKSKAVFFDHIQTAQI